MKRQLIIAALALLMMSGGASAERASEQCVARVAVNVTTLPVSASKMWDESNAAGVVWYRLPKGFHVFLFAYTSDGIWAWATAVIKPGEGPNAIEDAAADAGGGTLVTGWVKYSLLSCI